MNTDKQPIYLKVDPDTKEQMRRAARNDGRTLAGWAAKVLGDAAEASSDEGQRNDDNDKATAKP